MMGNLKPYVAYKDSGLAWLGQVPEHWDVKPTFGAFVPNRERNFGMKEKTVLSLSYGRIVVKPHEKLHGLVPESFETYQIVNPGDIVIRTTDLQNDHTSLRIGMVRNRGIITSAYLALLSQGGVSSEFGFQFLNVWDASKAIYGYGSGLRQSLGFSDFKRMPVAVPPPEEQSAIVRFLDWANARLERTIRAKRRVIALLTEQKQAIIHRAVTCGIDPLSEFHSTDNEWFPRLPTNCHPLTLRRVIHSAVDGPHFSPKYHDTGFPFLSARNVKVDRWSLADVKYISPSDFIDFSRRVKPEQGDVLYTKGGTTGVARVVDLTFPFQVWVHIAVLKLKSELIDSAYLTLCLNSPRCYEQSQLLTRGATNQDLGLGRMKDIVLSVPNSVEMQRSIVSAVEKELSPLLSQIGIVEREIDLLREYRTRLVADVVTGKLDVRDAAAALPQDELLSATEPDALDAGDDADADDELETNDEETAA